MSVRLDNEGGFSVTLSKDCYYVLKIEKDGYFTSTETFSTRGLRLSHGILNITTPINMIKTEIRHLTSWDINSNVRELEVQSDNNRWALHRLTID